MKKLLYFLIFAAAFSSCKKDTSTNVSITHADLAVINGQLKGTWVFPVQTLSVADSSGKLLSPAQNQPAPAFEFDGGSKVNIMPDSRNITKATYRLSTDKGFIYLHIDNADGSATTYQVLSVNGQTLKLNSAQPYAYYTGATEIAAIATSKTILTRQSAADITAHLIKVTVASDSSFSIGVYVQHRGVDTLSLVNSKANVTGGYSYTFAAKSGDHLSLDIFGRTSTSFYAYYNGLPLNGEVQLLGSEIKTDTGWDVP